MTTRTRLALLASYPESIVKFRGNLIVDLGARQVDTLVVAPGLTEGQLVREVRALGATPINIPMRRTGMNPLQDMRYVHALYRFFRSHKPNYMLAYTVKPVIYGMLAGWMAGVPRRFALITGLGYAFTGDREGIVKRIVGMLYRISLRRAHKVFFQNPDDERYFFEAGILPHSVPSVVINGSGVDVEAYAFHPVDIGPTSFLMIGRLLGDKGVREYVDAARVVKLAFPSVSFRLAGWIDENPDAIAISELDAWISEGVIDFLGKLDDVRPAIAQATVYVLPSHREGTPRTVLEAMAMGRAIITTDAPGCRETVVDAENGFLVPVKSVEALVRAMHKFIVEPPLASRMGLRSRQIAERKYDVCKVNAMMLGEMEITTGAGDGDGNNE